MKEGMSRGFESFQKKFLHGCITCFIRFRKNHLTANHTTEQADNPPLRYFIVLSHECTVFLLLVL